MAGPGKLNVLAVKRATRPGKYPDGGHSGLYLQVAATGAKSWLFRFKRDGRQTWVGLGPERDVTLAEAREAARECRRLLLAGIDPLQHRRAQRAGAAGGKTFEAALAAYLDNHRAGWRNEKHAAQWEASLAQHAAALFGMRVQAIGLAEVLKVLQPIWTTKPETASRVRGRIEAVLDFATAHNWRVGENPARWRGHLEQLLPARAKVARVQHHPALDWREVGAFVAELRDLQGTAARTLAFLILTAARSGEVRGARWSEMDLEGAIWTIPAERMKAGREHRVPLSEPALAILREMLPLRRRPDDLVFPGGRAGRPLSDVALAKVLRRLGRAGLTVHGFRSTFREWGAEHAHCAREVAEAALAHVNKDRTEAAYQRSDLFDRRARLMEEWAEFCTRPALAGEVAPLRA